MLFRSFAAASGFARGFAEDELVGRTLRIGPRATIRITGRDPRCKMITLAPDTAAPSPEIIRVVSEQHGGNAGVYAVTLVEGIIHPGDTITLLD